MITLKDIGSALLKPLDPTAITRAYATRRSLDRLVRGGEPHAVDDAQNYSVLTHDAAHVAAIAGGAMLTVINPCWILLPALSYVDRLCRIYEENEKSEMQAEQLLLYTNLDEQVFA